MYNSKITIDTLDALKPYEYIVEYFDDIHANTGENGQDIFTLLREYFRIVLRITDLRILIIDKRYMVKDYRAIYFMLCKTQITITSILRNSISSGKILKS